MWKRVAYIIVGREVNSVIAALIWGVIYVATAKRWLTLRVSVIPPRVCQLLWRYRRYKGGSLATAGLQWRHGVVSRAPECIMRLNTAHGTAPAAQGRQA